MEMIQSFRKRSRVNTDIEKFFTSAEDVRQLIEELRKLVDDVQGKETEILAVPIPNDTRNQELNNLYEKVKGSSSIIHAKLKAIGKSIQESEQKSNSKDTTIEMENHDRPTPFPSKEITTRYIPVALRIRRTQYSALRNQFTDVMTNYQLSQTVYRDKIKSRLKRQLEITNSSFSENDLEDMLEKGNVTVFTKSIMIDTKVAKKNLDDINARHNDLMKLEKSLVELAELFQELAQTVEEQGAVVSNIEKNIIDTQEYVRKGKDELENAVRLPKTIRKKKSLLITGVILLTIIFVIIIIIKVANII